jgi:hypothetical protein
VARLAYYYLYIQDIANARNYKQSTLPLDRLTKLLPASLINERTTINSWCEQVLKAKPQALARLETCRFNVI